MKGNNPRPFRILSLDGGGIRGAFGAAFLAELEARLRVRMCDYFDLIAGTSTGGIIAAGLTAGLPASQIESLYRDNGPAIFTPRPSCAQWWQKPLKWATNWGARKFGFDVTFDTLMQSKYTAESLKSCLVDVFDAKTFGDMKTRLVIPSVDLTGGKTVVFKTPHLPRMIRDRYLTVVDTLLATSAAPTYFPHAVFKPGSAYVDGGLWANNPAMVAIAEALRIRDRANRAEVDFDIDLEHIHMLSIGTGRSPLLTTPPLSGPGLFWWGPKVFDVSSNSQSQGVNFQASYILGERLLRVDCDLPNGRCALDGVELVNELAAIGHQQGIEQIDEVRGRFFHERKQHPYVEFEDENLVPGAAAEAGVAALA